MKQTHQTTIVLTSDTRRALARMALARGYLSPNRLDAGSISALLRGIGAGECVVLGPYAACDFAVLVSALEYALQHLTEWRQGLISADPATVLRSAIKTIQNEANWNDET